MYLQPRLIRFRDAPFYLGMDRKLFNAEVRPTLIEIPIGVQGIAFDRLDLDAWADGDDSGICQAHLAKHTQLQPRRIRMMHAPLYVGMDRKLFNELVRPFIPEVTVGKQGIAFERLDLDAWVDDHKHRSGRPAVQPIRGEKRWDAKQRQVSLREANTGILTNVSLDAAFERAQALARSRKPSATSTGGSRK